MGKYAASWNTPDGAPTATRRSFLSGNRNHCCSGGRQGGTEKVVATHCQRFFSPFFSMGTAEMEREGIHLRALETRTVAETSVPAKMWSGTLKSSSRSRKQRAEATPETAIAASITATTMYSKLFPVFSAATPISRITSAY